MKIEKTGLVLYTINYNACVEFYTNILGLTVLYTKEGLTCFDFHGSYFMVEFDDETTDTVVHQSKRDRVCIRLNVKNVKKACEPLVSNNIEFSYNEFEWGTIAKFRDPDHNLIGLRSSKEHLEDIEDSN